MVSDPAELDSAPAVPLSSEPDSADVSPVAEPSPSVPTLEDPVSDESPAPNVVAPDDSSVAEVEVSEAPLVGTPVSVEVIDTVVPELDPTLSVDDELPSVDAVDPSSAPTISSSPQPTEIPSTTHNETP